MDGQHDLPHTSAGLMLALAVDMLKLECDKLPELYLFTQPAALFGWYSALKRSLCDDTTLLTTNQDISCLN